MRRIPMTEIEASKVLGSFHDALLMPEFKSLWRAWVNYYPTDIDPYSIESVLRLIRIVKRKGRR